MTDTHTTAHIPDEAVHPMKSPSECCLYDIKKAIIAALPHLSAPCAVEVRRLEWEGCNHSIKAKTILGEYNVDKFAEKYRFYHLGGSTYQWHDALDQAKAAAQADFERRILSQIVTKPVDVAAAQGGARTVAINALQWIVDNPKESNAVVWDLATDALASIRALSPAEPVDQWSTDCGRLPTLEEAKQAARLLNACNGADLSDWTDDLWPCGDLTDGLKELISHDPISPTSKGGE